MTNRDFDRAIDAYAARQYGAFNQVQIAAAGGSRTMVEDRVRAERWFRLCPGVFAAAGYPATWQRQFKAAELSVSGSGLRRQSAALIHRLEGAKVLRPELVIPYTAKTRSPIANLHRSVSAPLTNVDRFRVTTVAHTLFDLLGCWTLDRVERTMDGAILSKLVAVEELEERRDELDGSRRPNLATYRALVDERTADAWAPAESELEFLAWPILRSVPGASFTRQVTMPWWQPGEGRVDAVSVGWRLIVEFDGRRWHARVRDFDRDRWRDAVAVGHGHTVVRFTYRHVVERPVEIAELLTAAGSTRLPLAS